MKKKKGFTLIELLAVIVILALIALIATPKLLQVIEDSKERARIQSFRALIKASDIYISQSIMLNGSLDGNLFDAVKDRIKGDKPDSGDVRYDKDLGLGITGEYDGYCYVKDFGSDEIYRDDNRENCVLNEELADACVTVEEKVLDINKDKCKEAITQMGAPYNDEELDKFCSGETASDGLSLQNMIEFGAIADFLDMGVINYTINNENCLSYMQENYGDFSSDDIIKICNGEEASDGSNFINIVQEQDYLDLTIKEVFTYTKTTGEQSCKSCFEYEDNVISFNINQPKCIEYFDENYSDWFEEEAELKEFCTYYDEPEEYDSLQSALIYHDVTYDELEKAGVISNIVTNGISIIDYNCYQGNFSGYPEKTTITLPSTIDNKKVIMIGKEAFSNSATWDGYYLTNIDFSKSVYLEKIDSHAFMGNYLTDLDLSKLPKLEEISYSAFENGKIKTLKLPLSIKFMDSSAFRDNEIEGVINLTSLINLESIEDYTFNGNNITNALLPDSVKYIGSASFSNNPLETVVIPKNVEAIGNNAFRKDNTYNKLETIVNKTGIAFDWQLITGSNYLDQTFVTGTIRHNSGDINVIPYTMDEIIYGDACYKTRKNFTYEIDKQVCKTYYSSNSNITDLDSFCSGNTVIGSDGYIYSIELDLLTDDYKTLIDTNIIKNIDYKDEYIITGYNCIGGDSGFPAIDIDKIPSTIEGKPVVAIAEEAFMDLEFESINLSEQTNLKIIGNSAFHTQDWQTPEIEIKLPSSLVTIGNNGFYYRKLKSLDMSNLSNLKNIGGLGFYHSDIFQEINMSNLVNLELLGEEAFYSNSFYGTLDLSNTKLKVIPHAAFAYNFIEDIKLPKNIETIEGSAFLFNSIAGIRVEDFQFYAGTNHSIRNTYYTPSPLDLSSYTNLKYIGDSAFESNQISAIKLPTSIVEIDSLAFSKNRITGVLDLSSNTNLKEIGSDAFSGDYTVKQNITSVIIPNSVSVIGEYAFWKNTNLTSITIDNVEGAISGSPWGAEDATINYLR